MPIQGAVVPLLAPLELLARVEAAIALTPDDWDALELARYATDYLILATDSVPKRRKASALVQLPVVRVEGQGAGPRDGIQQFAGRGRGGGWHWCKTVRACRT